MSVYIVQRGKNSVEASIQAERDRNTLGQTFMSVNDIPKTPTEPDEPETIFGSMESTDIPLNDINDEVPHQPIMTQPTVPNAFGLQGLQATTLPMEAYHAVSSLVI
jgi:hypothetical protein